MRKLRKMFRESVRQFYFIVVVIIVAFHFGSFIPPNILVLLGVAVFVGLFLRVIFKLKGKTAKYINSSGYVVLAREKELEHRYIAKQVVGRRLKSNEIVHHINGKKTDNRIINLCLMNREKHEHFHAWLKWKKDKSGKYPTFRSQKRSLEIEYGGILLENVKAINRYRNEVKEKGFKRVEEDIDLDFSEKLFAELRKERKRLADQGNIAAYRVFNDKTLREMVEVMPNSEAELLKINGVGPVKLQMYGAQFIAVIKKFKSA